MVNNFAVRSLTVKSSRPVRLVQLTGHRLSLLVRYQLTATVALP